MRKKIITQTKAELERFKELVETYGFDFNKSPKKEQLNHRVYRYHYPKLKVFY